jgi:hypothetical protein
MFLLTTKRSVEMIGFHSRHGLWLFICLGLAVVGMAAGAESSDTIKKKFETKIDFDRLLGTFASLDDPKGTLVAESSDAIKAKLEKIIDFDGLDDPKGTLFDALEYLRGRFPLKFYVDEKAFKASGIQDILKTEVQAKPAAKTALKIVLADILKKVGATYVVKENHVAIIPANKRK